MKRRNLWLGLSLLLGSSPLMAQESVYAPPAVDWVYTYDGVGDASADDAALDGSWSHNNGSDAWDGSKIAEGNPGGVQAIDEGGTTFLRIQEPGDPRGFNGIADPSNRKIAFHRDMLADGANAGNGTFSETYRPLNDGVTLNFRLRLPTTAPFDPLTAGGAQTDFPTDKGDGYVLHDSGKGTIAIHQVDDPESADDDSGLISFGLQYTSDNQGGNAASVDGLTMNALAGDAPSGDTDTGEGEENVLPLDNLTDWHEFWITIVRDETGGGTHRVEVYVDGSLEPNVFHVTSGTGEDNASTYLWMAQGATPQSGLVDIDFYRVTEGLHVPTAPSDPNVTVARTADLGQLPTVPQTHAGSIRVRNTGATKSLTLSNFSISGANADQFTLGATPGALAPGETGEIQVTFDSKGQTGAFGATLTFSSDDPDTASSSVSLRASVINAEGPAAHYALDDATGAEVVSDITGYGRHATAPGVTLGVTGLSAATGTAASVNGGTAIIAPGGPFDAFADFTISTLLKVNALPTGNPASIIAKGTDVGNPNFAVLLAPDGNLWWFVGDVQVFTTDNTPISAGQTHHLAVSHEASTSTVTLFVDGQVAISQAGVEAFTDAKGGTLEFGSFGGALPLNAVLDDIQVYTRLLTNEQVASLAATPGSVIQPEGAADSDKDGLTDLRESELGTNPLKADSDGDGLTDLQEVDTYGTNPLEADSDGDNRSDSKEIAAGTDPLDPNSPPPSDLVTLEVVEENLGGDAPAQVDPTVLFDEGVLCFSDRTHLHSGAAFDSGSGSLSTTGDLVVPLPSYLVGNTYVKFANDARDQAGYSATVTANRTVKWYLLLDNRIDGPAGAANSPNTEDPVLGGTFQWVIDGGWERVNTGISPNGQADYTALDESGDGSLNQFYAVFTRAEPSQSVTVSNNGTSGSNMISLVAVPASGGSTDGLVAYWSLDESAGTTAADATGNHPGTLVGTSEWRPGEGKFGGALFFDGTDGYIEVPDSDDFEFAEGEAWTASLWYKRDGVEDDQGLITKGYQDDSRATTGYWQLQTRAGSFTLDSRCCDGGDPRTRLDSSSGISHGDNEWHHVVVTRDPDAQEIRLYVDGQVTIHDMAATGTGAWAMGTNDDPLVIANHFNRFTVGWFDDIAIWKGRAFTDADVAAIAAAGVGATLNGGNGNGGGPNVEGLGDLTSVTRTATGVTIGLPREQTVNIEYSTTLEDGSWQAIASGVSGSYEDSDAARLANPRGFYRAVKP